jgi:hypothetical protein
MLVYRPVVESRLAIAAKTPAADGGQRIPIGSPWHHNGAPQLLRTRHVQLVLSAKRPGPWMSLLACPLMALGAAQRAPARKADALRPSHDVRYVCRALQPHAPGPIDDLSQQTAAGYVRRVSAHIGGRC